MQPDEDVLLQGIESIDDHRIETYEWTLVSGDSSVIMQVNGLQSTLLSITVTPVLEYLVVVLSFVFMRIQGLYS